jgi:hypothetical protein
MHYPSKFRSAKREQQTAKLCAHSGLRRLRATWLVSLLCAGPVQLHAQGPVVDVCASLITHQVGHNTPTDILLPVSPLPAWILNIVIPPSHGGVVGAPPTLIYTPNANYTGRDSMTFTATANGSVEEVKLSFIVKGVPGAPPSATDEPASTASETKSDLAQKWIAPPSDPLFLLEALQLLTTNPLPDRVDCKVLELLKEGDPYIHPDDLCRHAEMAVDHEHGVYQAALGNPDDFGVPTVSAPVDFATILAKANSLGLKAPDDEDRLFACTAKLIGTIYAGNSTQLSRSEVTHAPATRGGNIPGPMVLATIDQTFKISISNLAIYQLLDAYPRYLPGLPDHYAYELEDLRAAFEMNAKKLAKQVSDRVSASAP